MESNLHCPECGCVWQPGADCQAAFHQMLFWESDNPAFSEVHHLMVLCYHLQHPSLYSPEGLHYGIGLLVDFLEGGLTPQQTRQRSASQVDASQRQLKVKGTPGSHGAYPHPIQWKMTAIDVVARGEEDYPESVRKWARSMLADLRNSGNLITFD